MTHKWQIDLIDASSEEPKCQPCVKEEVEECVPAISADTNHAVKERDEEEVTRTDTVETAAAKTNIIVIGWTILLML